MEESKWFVVSRRFWLRFSVAIVAALGTLSLITPDVADAIVGTLCTAIGDSCDPAVWRARILLVAAVSASALKLWRTIFPDDSPPLTLLPKRGSTGLVLLLALAGSAPLVGCASGACPITADVVGSIAADGTWSLECRIREVAPSDEP